MTKNRTVVSIIGILSLMGGSAITSGGEIEACELSAHHAHTSCKQQVIADYWLSVARCDNLPTRAKQQACMAQASQDRVAARTDCKARFHVREEICEELGDEPYHPEIDPEEFDTEIANTFLPWIPGTTFIYDGTTARGVEHIEVVVSHETREIQGVECVQVRDTVSLNGDVIEDTLDWYAQDDADNVWYFGESVQDFEDGLVSSLSGSFMAGVNGAKAGIAMKTAPQIGDFYRQEFDIDNAEDVARVLSLTETVTVPYGTFTNCLKTEEFAPTGPGQIEHKYYAEDIGLVLIVNLDTGDRVELLNVIEE